MESGIKQLCNAWYEAGSAVFLTGAGVSTESGLLDFTGAGSVFRGASSKELLSREFMLRDPVVFHEYCRKRLYNPAVRPNLMHKALAQWEVSGLVAGIITQNIDSLHQRAGSENVIELHGNMLTMYCDSCKQWAATEEFYKKEPCRVICPHCGGVIRPSIVLYGEKLAEETLAKALDAIDNIPLLIVAGTRIKVTAPLDIVERFKRHPGVSVYIGDTPPETCDFDILLKGRIGAIVEKLRVNIF